MEEKEERKKLTLEDLTLPEEEAEKVLQKATKYRVKKAMNLLGPDARQKNLAELLQEVKEKLDKDYTYNNRDKLYAEVIQEHMDGESVERLRQISSQREEIDAKLKELQDSIRPVQGKIYGLVDEGHKLDRESSEIRRQAEYDVHFDPKVLVWDAERQRLMEAERFIKDLIYGKRGHYY